MDIAEVRIIVRDSTGQALGYFPSTMSRNARRMAANFAKLPEFLRQAARTLNDLPGITHICVA